ncbi:hypothetical protein B5H54_16160 [Listeria monocytogenes]|nr:hypothetical protein [Listeria monocytogenes]EAC2325872.1 hypothetical protein [Listeria monocytogenes]EAC2688318.1 hypothetical protein [Listeria monocytogenes]EAC5359873.1 hypothetical protein [Listeria monocytogenes]EAC5366726.1 hypothetical protein [Listeria monocytogenes]
MIDKDLVTVVKVYLLNATEDFADRLSQAEWTNTEEGDKTNAHFQCILAFVQNYTDLIDGFLKDQEESV